jgi:nicotinamide-nucleotide amidase
LSGWGENESILKKEMQTQIERVIPFIKEFIYNETDQEIEETIGELLIKHNKKIAVAESCTGGYVSHSLTKVPGSSKYFNGCIIPYHNEFKINTLHVKKETIGKHGAVSEETVREMATQVRLLFNSDIGIACSGIAGPGGATPEKPVGTIWIAYADAEKVITKKLQLGGKRLINIQGTAMALFNLVRVELGK